MICSRNPRNPVSKSSDLDTRRLKYKYDTALEVVSVVFMVFSRILVAHENVARKQTNSVLKFP